MEATGGYEQQTFAQLWAEGLPVALLNPRQVRQFAQSMGVLEKTDALDAVWRALAPNGVEGPRSSSRAPLFEPFCHQHRNELP